MCHHFYEFSLKEKRKKIPKYKKEDSLLFHLFMFISEISPALTLGCEHKILSLCPLEKKRKTINSKPCDLLFGTYGCLSAALLVFRHLSASPTLTLYILCLCKVYCIPVKLKLLAILFHLSNSGSRECWRVYPSCCRVRSRLHP